VGSEQVTGTVTAVLQYCVFCLQQLHYVPENMDLMYKPAYFTNL